MVVVLTSSSLIFHSAFTPSQTIADFLLGHNLPEYAAEVAQLDRLRQLPVEPHAVEASALCMLGGIAHNLGRRQVSRGLHPLLEHARGVRAIKHGHIYIHAHQSESLVLLPPKFLHLVYRFHTVLGPSDRQIFDHSLQHLTQGLDVEYGVVHN